eukprot:GHVP01026300.1.p1 GENE.GHVP01026300.1~~GHVP01026300.1.p1  ORF type:complete len:265 (+),score=88.91 GHVP01026300.1:138-932(+)
MTGTVEIAAQCADMCVKQYEEIQKDLRESLESTAFTLATAQNKIFHNYYEELLEKQKQLEEKIKEAEKINKKFDAEKKSLQKEQAKLSEKLINANQKKEESDAKIAETILLKEELETMLKKMKEKSEENEKENEDLRRQLVATAPNPAPASEPVTRKRAQEPSSDSPKAPKKKTKRVDPPKVSPRIQELENQKNILKNEPNAEEKQDTQDALPKKKARKDGKSAKIQFDENSLKAEAISEPVVKSELKSAKTKTEPKAKSKVLV